MKQRTNTCIKALLAGVCAQSVLFSSALLPVFAAETETIINDDSAEITYSSGNANNGGWGAGSGSTKEASEHWANTANASFSFSFTGNAIELWGIKAPNHRMMSIEIDGGEAVEFDCYNASRTSSEMLFSSREAGIELEDTEHSVVVRTIDKQNEAATGSTIGVSFNYARVYSNSKAPDPEEPDFEGFSIVENSVVTTSDEPFKISYNGTWYQESGYPNLFHNGDDAYSNTVGDSYDVTFTGTKIEIYASKNPAHGTYSITIDGVDQGSVNSGDVSSTTHQQKIFESETLENGVHTMHVSLDDIDANSGKAIQVDYLKITHPELFADSITLSRNSLTLAPGGTASLETSITPWVATSDLVWSSSDPAISVENGVISVAEDAGKTNAIITVYSEADPSVKAECSVAVDPDRQVITAYVGNEKLLELAENIDDLRSGSGESFSATAWKNDSVSSKIVVAAESRALNNVTLTPSVFTDENGNKLPADAISATWLEEVNANIGRGNSSAPVKAFPDKIGKKTTINIDANDAAFGWVTISIPEDAKAGTYTGTVSVSADELGEAKVFDYTVEVVDLSLENKMDLQLWQHPYSVANYYLKLGATPTGGISYERDDDFYFTKAHFDLMRDSMVDYAKAGGHDAVANIVEEAWNHQSYYDDISMVSWAKDADGNWEFDYSWYDAWVEFMIECGVLDPAENLGQIKCYSIVPWNNQIQYYDYASSSWKTETYTPGTDGFNTVWTAFLTDFMAHSKEKGWLDVTYISMDERNISQLRPAVSLIKSIKDEDGKSFKISSAMNADYTQPSYYDFLDQVEDISVNLGSADRNAMKALSEHRKPLGLNTTIYTCTGDYPGNFTISDPQDNYWSALYCLASGTDGYMKWAFDNYVYDMDDNITYRYWEPGDGWFIYPESREGYTNGDARSYLSTPRYELLKKGLRDASKAKILLEHDGVSDETKAELQAALDAMNRPAKGGSYGSATYANAAARASVTNMIEAVMAKVEKAEKEAEKAPVVTVDKTALETAIANAEAKKTAGLNGILKSRIDAFNKALDDAKAVLSDSKAAQEAVNVAVQALNTAADALIKEDKSALNTAIAAAEAVDLDDYQDGEQKTAFENALKAAKEIAKEDAVLEENTIASALKTLNDAKAALVKKPEVPSVDKSGLQSAISAAETKKAAGLDGILKSKVDAFNKALDDAKALMANDAADQASVNAAAKALDDAAAALVKEDKSALKAAIARAEAIDLNEYVDGEAKSAFENALKAAKEIARDDAVLEEVTIADAMKVLNDAKAALVKKPVITPVDRADLEKAINAAEAKKAGGLNGILKSKVNAFNKALNDAKAAAADKDASQAEIDQAAKALNDAAAALVKEDKSALLEAIERHGKTDLDSYKDDVHKQNYIQAIEQAKALAKDDAELEDDAIPSVLKALETHYAALNKKPSTPDNPDDPAKPDAEAEKLISQIQAKLKAFKDLSEKSYTASSWAKLEKAAEKAEALLKETDPSKEDLKSALDDLDQAMTGLVKASGTGTKNPADNSGTGTKKPADNAGTTKKPATGISGTAMSLMSFFTASAAGLALSIRRRKNPK